MTIRSWGFLIRSHFDGEIINGPTFRPVLSLYSLGIITEQKSPLIK